MDNVLHPHRHEKCGKKELTSGFSKIVDILLTTKVSSKYYSQLEEVLELLDSRPNLKRMFYTLL